MVKEYESVNGQVEQYLLLKSKPIDEERLPSSEKSRRDKVAGFRFFVRIYVNTKLVATTKKAAVNFPKYQLEFREKVSLLLYAQPYSIKMELCSAGFFTEVIDSIEIEVPGESAKTLTSTSSVIRDLEFRKIKPPKKVVKPKSKKEASAEALVAEDEEKKLLKDEDEEKVRQEDEDEEDPDKNKDGDLALVKEEEEEEEGLAKPHKAGEP